MGPRNNPRLADGARRYTLCDFDYALPTDLIAQVPAPVRSASRLLDVTGPTLVDRRFADLPALLQRGDLVVFNDTRVIRARLAGVKPSGGRVEMLIERIVATDEAWAQLKASHLPRVGTLVNFVGGVTAEVLERDERFFRLRFRGAGSLPEWLEQHGDIPLPPYIVRASGKEDAERYQTVYAKQPGAVAAPTAGFHFEQETLVALAQRGVATAYLTLHVGAGTFQPVATEDLSQHRMHREWFEIPQATADAVARTRAAGGRIIAIGTTSLRALESAAREDDTIAAGPSETALFITPGYAFRVVDALLTNFHLPRSTLLMLVSAFAGYETIRAAYAHAIRERYRFYSYGDAMLLARADR